MKSLFYFTFVVETRQIHIRLQLIPVKSDSGIGFEFD